MYVYIVNLVHDFIYDTNPHIELLGVFNDFYAIKNNVLNNYRFSIPIDDFNRLENEKDIKIHLTSESHYIQIIKRVLNNDIEGLYAVGGEIYNASQEKINQLSK